MQYKITKFPYKIFEGYQLTLIEGKSGKMTLTFYNFHTLPGKKIQVSFYGRIYKSPGIETQTITSIAVNDTLGFQMQHEVLNFTQIKNGVEIKPIKFEDLVDFQEVIFFFGEKLELKLAAKNLTINEVDEEKIIFRTRKMVMPGDLNGAGSLFGGKACAWIDEEAAIYAACQMGGIKHLVTAHMSSITFESPAVLGDIIEIGCDVVKFGETSITIKVVMRNKTSKKHICSVEEIIFVALDENGVPKPHGKTIKSE